MWVSTLDLLQESKGPPPNPTSCKSPGTGGETETPVSVVSTLDPVRSDVHPGITTHVRGRGHPKPQSRAQGSYWRVTPRLISNDPDSGSYPLLSTESEMSDRSPSPWTTREHEGWILPREDIRLRPSLNLVNRFREDQTEVRLDRVRCFERRPQFWCGWVQETSPSWVHDTDTDLVYGVNGELRSGSPKRGRVLVFRDWTLRGLVIDGEHDRPSKGVSRDTRSYVLPE